MISFDVIPSSFSPSSSAVVMPPDLGNRADRLQEICRDWLSEDPTLGEVSKGPDEGTIAR